MHESGSRALVIAHEPDCHGGRVATRLEARGYAVDTHVVTPDESRPNDALPFPDIAGYDLLAVMGSARSLTRRDEISSWIEAELDLIRAADRSGQPVLGVCFGGQLIAAALGGSVEVAPVTELGWVTIEAPAGETNPVGPGPWFEWHHDRFEPPAAARVLAVSPNAAQLFTVGRMAGTQFHPEVDVAHIARWLESSEDSYLEAYGQTRQRMLAEAAEHEAANIARCEALVDWFLDEIAFPDTGRAEADHATASPVGDSVAVARP